MGDVYVYHFHTLEADGISSSRSTVAATLSAIEKIGLPIMESQIVVDSSEVTPDGFLVPAVDYGSTKITRLSARIRSLELRADARDLQAQSMNPSIEGATIYMLSLESRHLRQQAQTLAIQRAAILAGGSGQLSVAAAFPHFAGPAPPE